MLKKSLADVAALAAQFTHSPASDQAQAERRNESASFEEGFRNVIIDMADIEPEEDTLEADLKEDLALDSLDMIEMVMICEKEFRISIADMEWMKVRTVGEMLELVKGRLEPREAKFAA